MILLAGKGVFFAKARSQLFHPLCWNFDLGMFDPRAKILNEFIYHFFIQGIIVLVGSQHFPKNEQFLSPETHTYVYISGSKKC